MAKGDVVMFNEAKVKMIAGDWATTDHFYFAVLTNAVNPSASTTTPTLSDFTQVASAGTYPSGGTDLGTLASMVTQSAGAAKIDSATNPTYAADASNGTNAYWGLVYNYTDGAHDAWMYVDLGGPVDMTAIDLTNTWNASGLYTF